MDEVNTESSEGKMFHSNDNYTVVVSDGMEGYDVINDNSGVVEFKSESLPEAIFAAENLNVVLVHRTYEWVAKRARDKAIEDAGIQRLSSVSKLDS